MGHRKRLLSIIAGVVLVGALPSIAMANTTEAIAQTGGMTLTLVGVPLNLGITLDQFGKIDMVTIDTTFSPDHQSDHKVTFERAGDGSTVVKVKAEGQKLTAKIKTSNIDELVGAQNWSADVFGTGDPTSVDFNIIKVGEGDSAYLMIDGPPGVTPGAGIDFEVSGPTTDSDDDDDDDDESEYESKAYVTFTMDGFTKTLTISVETEYEDDEDHEGVRAKLKVELRGKDVQNLVGEAAIGEKTWTGLLCDGTASVTYTVDAEGNVAVGLISADGYTWNVDTDEDGFEVQFASTTDSEDDGAYVKVEVDDEDGMLELKVKSKTTSSCDDGDDHDDDDDDDDDDEDHDDDDDDDDEDDDENDDDDDDEDDD